MAGVNQAILPLDDYVAACDATRAKGGTTSAAIKSGELAGAIRAIPGPKPEQEKSATATKNGPVVLTPDNGKVLSKATVNVAVPSDKKPEQAKSVTYTTNGKRTVSPDGGKVLTGVTVDVNVPDKPPVVQALTATENKVYNPPAGVDGYAPVTVNVPTGGGGVESVDVTFTSFGRFTCVFTGSEGFLSEVVVDEKTEVRKVRKNTVIAFWNVGYRDDIVLSGGLEYVTRMNNKYGVKVLGSGTLEVRPYGGGSGGGN